MATSLVGLLFCIAFSLLCAVLYRCGGSGNYPRYFRTAFIPMIVALFAFILGVKSYWLLLMIPLTVGAISTYLDEAPWNHGVDSHWQHGLLVGLAAFPICIVTGHWWLFAFRVIILTVWAGVWSRIFKDAVIEELGRLAPLIPTVYMLV